MQIETIRFGAMEVDDGKLLEFDEGIPGLEEFRKFALLRFEESYPIIWLQSVEDGGVCLPVMDTFAVLPGYVFDLEDEDVSHLDMKGPEDLLVVSVLVVPEEIKGMTANLAAPIVVNVSTGKAMQVMLSGSNYNIRTPIFSAICDMIMREEREADACSVKEAQ